MYVNLYTYIYTYNEFPRWLSSTEFTCDAGDVDSIPGSGTPLEEGMATQAGGGLAWKILWTEEPGGLQSMESQRVGHD